MRHGEMLAMTARTLASFSKTALAFQPTGLLSSYAAPLLIAMLAPV